MNWAVKLSITERVVTVAERVSRYPARPPRSSTDEAASSGWDSTSEATSDAADAAAGAAAGTRAEQRRRCAFVVDRDPEVVSGLSALLMPQLDVQSAVSPPSAALLLEQLEHVDLAFVELELPDFAGEQLLQQLGRWPDAIRVLLAQPSANAAMASQLPPGLPASPMPASPMPPSPVPPNPVPPNQLRPNQVPSNQLRRPSALATSALPRNAYLAHLVLSKPISPQVVRALQRATLGLLRI
jgi:CheY-like chemotaxis protein